MGSNKKANEVTTTEKKRNTFTSIASHTHKRFLCILEQQSVTSNANVLHNRRCCRRRRRHSCTAPFNCQLFLFLINSRLTHSMDEYSKIQILLLFFVTDFFSGDKFAHQLSHKISQLAHRYEAETKNEMKCFFYKKKQRIEWNTLTGRWNVCCCLYWCVWCRL